jgi:UDP-2,3-diacylglucosamine hydrolase
LGKLAEISDAGIPIVVFTGNHDMWMSGYFEEELNITVYHEPQTFVWNNKKILIGHGDGLGPGDHGYKLLKKVFTNPICKWLFRILHPDWGIGLANYFSRKSKEKTGVTDDHFLGEDQEWLIVYCKEVLKKEYFDFLIFGHRHYPIDFPLSGESRYINLGDWIKNFTYAEFDGSNIQLKKFES